MFGGLGALGVVWLVAGAVGGISGANAQVSGEVSGGGKAELPTAASVRAAASGVSGAAADAAAVIDLKEFAARSITRLALMDFRIHMPLTPSDFQVALGLLEIASEHTPDDLGLVRLRALVADTAEDKDKLEPLLRRLYVADPRDTAAQYQLIALRLSRIQLAEDRLRAYERFIGPEGATLDVSIRSRLASDAAFLHRQRGETQGFVDKLKVATSLDSTNQEAAKAALEYFDQRVDDPIGRLDLIANLLYADISDSQTHGEMAHALASVGVFDGARRFSKSAQMILDRAGLTQDAVGFLGELATDWSVDGAASVTQRLSVALASQRQETASLIKQLQAQLVPTDDIPKPEEVRLDARLDRVRLLAARTAGDQGTVDAATADIKKSYDAALVEMKKMMTGGQVTETELVEQSRAVRLELVTLLCWANVDLESAGKDFEAVAAEPANDAEDAGFQEARAWVTLRRGQAEEALGMFEPLTVERAGSRVGQATALEALGKKDAAVAMYRGIVREFPITADAAWAVGRLIELTGQTDVDPELTPKARRFFNALPGWLEEGSVDPARFMALSAETTRSSAHNLERSEVHLRLTNTSMIPLGVGNGATLESRVLVSPQLEVGTEEIRSTLPEVIDVRRRLRLLPNESIDFTFWPDPGLTGWLIESNCREAARVRFRVIQGYVRGGQGEVLVGPMSLACGTQATIRSPLAESRLAAADFAARVVDAPERDMPRLVTAARSLLLAVKDADAGAKKVGVKKSDDLEALAEPLLSLEERSAVAQAFAGRYSKASVEARAVMLTGLPHEMQVTEMKAFDEAVRSETEPNLVALILVSRVSEEQDLMLVAAKASSDARLAGLASEISLRLSAGSSPYAKLGPGLVGLTSEAVPDSRGTSK